MVASNSLGRLLFIDLGNRRTETREVTGEDIAGWIGGRGLGTRLLRELLPPAADPLGPNNPLIITLGPLTGTVVPMASRFVVTAKSPLTNIFGMSFCGGSLGAEMRTAGYMGVVIQGAAEEPCWLFCEPGGQVQFRDAKSLWGLDAFQTQDRVRAELGDLKTKVACIGPAGENLVKIAAIVSDRRVAGRTGMGAVMGSKKLKAIAFRSASGQKVPVQDDEKLAQLAAECVKKLTASPVTKGLGEFGTPRGIMTMNTVGILPTRNHRTGVFADATCISGERLKNEFTTKKFTTCYRCPVVCSRITEVKEGPYQGAETEGPDYETLWALGSECGNSNIESIIHADMVCDKLGLDTMSVGSAIALAMECYERGLLTREDTGGLDLRFGAHEAMTKLITQIAYRQGLGEALGGSPLDLVKQIPDAQSFAMHVKGLWLGGYDPRGLKGAGLAFATANRGGCHSAGGYTIHAELHGGDARFSTEGKPKLVKGARDMRALYDSAVMCSFSMSVLGTEPPRQMIAAATGVEMDEQAWTSAINRICDTERALSVREGLQPGHDTLPDRLIKEPAPEGPCQGQVVELDGMKKEYYELLGWDPVSGAPKSVSI